MLTASYTAALAARAPKAQPAEPTRRTKLWDISGNLHCSIIGTCLSAAELRQVLRKLGLAPPGSTDHELHKVAVTLAGRHDKAAKVLNKALDARHRLAVSRFDRAHTDGEVRSLWQQAMQCGEVPGAYWATLTHPATSHDLMRDVFGEVHMLSHLVGAANRADIRRLCVLEHETARLQAQMERQQHAFREAVVARDATIRNLRHALAERIAADGSADATDGADEAQILRQLVRDLERRLSSEARRNLALREKLAAADTLISAERSARRKAEQECLALKSELDLLEESFTPGLAQASGDVPELRLPGVTVLYVGGRPSQVAHLRIIVERSGATFLHHDGGVEHHLNLLAGQTSRADFMVFPVDCISHHAAQTVKQLCRQTGKPFAPLRSASTTALLIALRRHMEAGALKQAS